MKQHERRVGRRGLPWHGRALATAIVLAALAPIAVTREAQDTGKEPAAPELVTNVFYDTSVRQALADIASQTGVIIVPDQSVQGFVTCELKDEPLEHALEIVLSAGGFVYRQLDGYIVVGSPTPESPLFTALSETRFVELDHIKAADAADRLPAALSRYVKAGKTGGGLTISAPPELVKRIASDLEAMDRPPRQVVLEARVVELTRQHTEKLGVDWSYEWMKPFDTPGLEGGTSAWNSVAGKLGLGYTTTGTFTKQLLLDLMLLMDNNWATIVANPKVTAQDGETAKIKVTTEEYFLIVTEGVYYRSELEQIESGITLEVTPHVCKNSEIQLRISPEVSNVVGKGSQNLPVITRRSVTTTVRIGDGGTVVVAGLRSSFDRHDENRVPALGGIPLLGNLFRSDEVYDLERQVTVLITARIVGPDGERRKPPRPRVIRGPSGESFRAELARSLERYPEVE